MDTLLYMRYAFMGLNILSFVMLVVAIITFIFKHKTNVYTILNINDILKGENAIYWTLLTYRALVLVLNFSRKGLSTFFLFWLLCFAVSAIFELFILKVFSKVDTKVGYEMKNNSFYILSGSEHIKVAILYVIFTVVNSVIAYLSFNTIDVAIVAQNIPLIIWLGLVAELILMILVLYCRLKTFSLTTLFVLNEYYFLLRAGLASTRLVKKIHKTLFEQSLKDFKGLKKKFKRYYKKYGEETSQAMLLAAITQETDKTTINIFAKQICAIYGWDLNKI